MSAKTIWGNIKGDGSIISGLGYKIDKVSTGLYTIIFDESFNSAPGVAVTQVYAGDDNKGGNTRDNAVLVLVERDRFRIKTGNDQGHVEDRNFSFVASGVV